MRNTPQLLVPDADYAVCLPETHAESIYLSKCSMAQGCSPLSESSANSGGLAWCTVPPVAEQSPKDASQLLHGHIHSRNVHIAIRRGQQQQLDQHHGIDQVYGHHCRTGR